MRKMSIRAAAAAALIALLTAPSVSARDKEHQQLAADLRMLQEQSQQLQNLLGQLGEALKAVNQRLDDQGKANVKAFADQKLIIDTVSKDLAVVREKLDDTNTRVGSISQEVDALRQSVQQLPLRTAAPPEFSDGTASAGTTAPPGATPAGGGATPLPPVGLSPQRLYDQARTDYGSGLYDLAISGFKAFLNTFPKHDMADDAQVEIGNAYLQDGKYDKAVEAYDLAIRTYQGGNAIPDAYYKKGIALEALKQFAPARDAWEYLVKTYPESVAASLARQRLARPQGR
jgi:tol-pal system protein YbgF